VTETTGASHDVGAGNHGGRVTGAAMVIVSRRSPRTMNLLTDVRI